MNNKMTFISFIVAGLFIVGCGGNAGTDLVKKANAESNPIAQVKILGEETKPELSKEEAEVLLKKLDEIHGLEMAKNKKLRDAADISDHIKILAQFMPFKKEYSEARRSIKKRTKK